MLFVEIIVSLIMLGLIALIAIGTMHVSFNTHKFIKDGEEVVPILIPFVAWGRMAKGLFVKKPYRRW